MKDMVPILSLAFLLALNFGGWMLWIGKLSERVKRLEEDSKDDKTDREKVIRLEVQLENMDKNLEGIRREMANMSRQLANLATQKFAGIAGE